MKRILIIFAALFALTACNDDDGYESSWEKTEKKNKAFEEILEEETGHAHDVAKKYTGVDGYVVYQDLVTGEYVAYNVDKYDSSTMSTFADYEAVMISGDAIFNLDKEKIWKESGYWDSIYETRVYYDDYYDWECDCWVTEMYEEEVYVDSVWVDTSGYKTYYYGGGLVFDNKSSASKNLEMFEALEEQVAEGFVEAKLKSDFSLSATRAKELAHMLTRYKKLTSTRELAAAEKSKFTMSAFGTDVVSIEKALKAKSEGRDNEYDDLMQKAAKVNQTTPESIGRFFDEYVTN